jgi:hypothetical protein
VKYLRTIKKDGGIRRYVAIDHDGDANESTIPRNETKGTTRARRIPFTASCALISGDVRLAFLVRYHQWIQKSVPRMNMLA